MRKKVKCVVVMIIVLCITSCSIKVNDSEKEPGRLQEKLHNQVENQNEGNLKNDVTLLTMFSEDDISDNFSNPVAQKITEKTGVKIEVEVPVGNVNEKIGIMMASGDYPDFILVKHMGQFVDSGAYIDLKPLIDEYGPNLKKLYGSYLNRLEYSEEDSSIYVLPTSPINNINWLPNAGFELQHAVVKELNYPKLETIYDFEEAIKKYINEHPTINGLPTIGISLITDDWRWLVSLSNPGAFATGRPDDGQWYIDPISYEATYRFSRDDEKEYFRWLNHMYDIGLIDPDSFVQKYEAYVAKIALGRVLGLIDSRWQYTNIEQILKTEGMDERTYGQYPLQVDTSTLAADYRDVGYRSGYGIGISVNCKDPIKAIQFLDFMASDEGQVLRHWGIEDINYFINTEGKREFYADQIEQQHNNPNYKEETGVNNYIYPYPTWGDGVLDKSGNYYSANTLDSVMDNYSESEKETLKAYGIKTWSDLYPKAEVLDKSVWGEAWSIPVPEDSGIQMILKKCDEIVKQGLIIAIISSPHDFDKNWENMQNQLNDANVDKLNAKFTEIVKMRVEAWK